MANFPRPVRFKCNQTGNIFEFISEHDIKTMKTHPEYQEVVEDQEVIEDKPVKRTYNKSIDKE